MARLIDKAALIKSEQTPLYEAAKKELGKSGRSLHLAIWGESLATVESWFKRANPPKYDVNVTNNVLSTLCNNYNNFISSYGSKLSIRDRNRVLEERRVITQKLEPIDFHKSVKRFDFAEKIGCEMTDWQITQQAIDNVLLDYSLIGRENSSSREDASAIWNLLGGANTIYFKSLSVNQIVPILLRAILRVKRPIQAIEGIYYVPCRLYIPPPTTQQLNINMGEDGEKPWVEYQGKVALRDNNLYFTFTSVASGIGDSVMIILSMESPWHRGFYNGLYSSTSVAKKLYSSALLLKRNDLDLSHPRHMREFIDSHITYMNNNLLESDLSEAEKRIVEERLKTSPFSPFT
ncbi:MAG: hypothetical protein KDJ38_02340 [Gammaproteobacteria bacterium]|nr:hypothetical protein [Gammaproteobacteria bacterium]